MESASLERLAMFLSPGNFLDWREKWRNNYPKGERVVMDAESFEDVRFSEKEDFQRKLDHYIDRLAIELTQHKIHELNNQSAPSRVNPELGSKLQSILNLAHNSRVMSEFEDIIEKSFYLLQNRLLQVLDIDIKFSDIRTGPKSISRTIIDLPSLADKRVGTAGFETPLPAKTETEKIYTYKINPSPVVRKYLAFLDPNGINSQSTLSADEYNHLVQIIDRMFEVQCVVDPNITFKHGISRFKREVIIQAFGDMQEILLEEERPSWYVPSMKSLFQLKGDVVNLGKKLKDGKQIERLRGKQKDLFPEP